jgi:predicted transcriptional regulator
MMTKSSASEEATPMRSKPGFQRRYGLDVQDRAIRLRRAGRSLNEVAREVGVSPSQIKRWVWARERAEGTRDQDTRAIAARRQGRSLEALRSWHGAKLQRIASTLERSRDPKEISALRSAANVYYQAFRVMTMRFEGTQDGDEDMKKYQKYLDGQLAKEQDRRVKTIKRARADATAAEPIELTVEPEVEGRRG